MKNIICLMSMILAIATAPVMASDDTAAINILLDNFHDAAAKADKDRYLGLFAKSGVFLGTAAGERWLVFPDFEKYVAGRFATGTGWTYKSVSRNITISDDSKIAWFDEITESSSGLFNGTGVLLKQDNSWKVAQYSLTFLIPNEIWAPVSDLAKAEMKRQKAVAK